MSSLAPHALHDPADKSGKRRRVEPAGSGETAEGVVPPLWQSALGTVLSHLATSHFEQLVDGLVKHPETRKALTERLVRKAQHGSTLGDSDLVEVVKQQPCKSQTSLFTEEIRCVIRVGQLPHRIRVAIKQLFSTATSRKHKRCSWGFGNYTEDGRVLFVLEDPNDSGAHRPDDRLADWTDAYIKQLKKLIFEDCIGLNEGVDDEVGEFGEWQDFYPHVQSDTLEYDAYEFIFNNAEDTLRDAFETQLMEIFTDDMDEVTTHLDKYNCEPVIQTVDQVWVRKPRVRVLVRKGLEEDSDEE